MGQMRQVMVNNFVNAALTAVFLAVVLSVLVYSIKSIRVARAQPVRTDRETAYVALQAGAASWAGRKGIAATESRIVRARRRIIESMGLRVP